MDFEWYLLTHLIVYCVNRLLKCSFMVGISACRVLVLTAQSFVSDFISYSTARILFVLVCQAQAQKEPHPAYPCKLLYVDKLTACSLVQRTIDNLYCSPSNSSGLVIPMAVTLCLGLLSWQIQ